MKTFPTLWADIKSQTRGALTRREIFDREFDAEIYRQHRNFLHKEMPDMRRGILPPWCVAMIEEYPGMYRDLVADQAYTLVTCINYRAR